MFYFDFLLDVCLVLFFTPYHRHYDNRVLSYSGNNPRGYNNQRYNQRQSQYQSQNGNPNLYHTMAAPYVMQPAGGAAPDGMQSIIGHKFFQGRGLPGAANPCAYQSMGQGQAATYSQFPGAMQYAYQYTQPPTATVQQ